MGQEVLQPLGAFFSPPITLLSENSVKAWTLSHRKKKHLLHQASRCCQELPFLLTTLLSCCSSFPTESCRGLQKHPQPEQEIRAELTAPGPALSLWSSCAAAGWTKELLLTYSKLTPDLLPALQQQHCTPLAPDGRMLSVRLSALAGSWCNCLHLSALLSAHWSSRAEAIASIYRWGTLHCRFSATFSKACQKHEGLHFTRHSGELAKLLWKIFCKVTFSNSSNWLPQFPVLRPDHVRLLAFCRYQRFLSTIPPAQVSEKGPGQ